METPNSLTEPLHFLFVHTVLNWLLAALWSLSSSPLSFLHRHIGLLRASRGQGEQPTKVTTTVGCDRNTLSREEMKTVFDRMGLQLQCCGGDSEDSSSHVGFEELCGVFEDEEPSLRELREAFCIFDDKCDGFIDAQELQRALLRFGCSEGSSLDACEKMIAAYDENGDKKIDFKEFVKFMEISFC